MYINISPVRYVVTEPRHNEINSMRDRLVRGTLALGASPCVTKGFNGMALVVHVRSENALATRRANYQESEVGNGTFTFPKRAHDVLPIG